MKLAGLVLWAFWLVGSPHAFADATGSWVGWGTWQFDGKGPRCQMSIAYQETEASLKRLRGVFDCEVAVLHSDPLGWAKTGNALFLDGKPAGESSAQGFTATEGYGDGVVVRTTFQREGRHADYLEVWTGKDGREIYRIKGRLFLRSR
jgi:hypothetical protein